MSNETMTLGELGYEYGEKHGQFSVYPYGVRYFFDKDYGCSSVNFGYEEVCAMKLEMEKKQNE